jgi:hypothetical protein
MFEYMGAKPEELESVGFAGRLSHPEDVERLRVIPFLEDELNGELTLLTVARVGDLYESGRLGIADYF